MSIEDKAVSATEMVKQIMQNPGEYVCREHYRFASSAVFDKYEFERRFVEAFKEEQIQVLRYIAKASYADNVCLFASADALKRSGKMSTVVTDREYIKKMADTLTRYGAVCKRTYIDPQNVSKDGEQIKDSSSLVVYCLTEMGAALLRRKTEYGEYIEEFLWEAGSLDIMRRVATNRVVVNLRDKFPGYSDMCTTYRVTGLKRQPVYGRCENDENLLIYEPVFFNREETVQTEKELLSHYKERSEFLTRYFDEVGKSKRKTLVILVEQYDRIKEALSLYDDVIKSVGEVYVSSENLVKKSVVGGAAFPYAPFLKIVKIEDKTKVNQATPTAFKK